ncbi:hypothetical protein [Magnetospirillum fulvum]|uniref:Uncharacterized protein n=1 Tax=Magnetospirillum fulvum TaxID=1082 RepID=A0A1H6K0A7_MAGFU|nr:hypothetical protein [Magnetospirillum fulvum]SEH66347.1 hypothetical protein SAMN04244559_03350 [Magnetospirillum fulvum]
MKTPIMTTILASFGLGCTGVAVIMNSTPGAIGGLALILFAIFLVLKDMASSED